jgi:hypothetical protein
MIYRSRQIGVGSGNRQQLIYRAEAMSTLGRGIELRARKGLVAQDESNNPAQERQRRQIEQAAE